MKKEDIEVLDKFMREKPTCCVRIEDGKPKSMHLAFKTEEGGIRGYWFHGEVEESKNGRFFIPFDGTDFAFCRKEK